jgi:preprotein translocase subunit YajC
MSLAFLQDVTPKAGTPGVAQPSGPSPAAGGGTPGGGSMLTMLLPFLIMVPFLFMMFRRNKKEQEARASLKKGDKVVTQAGLIGELVELDEKVAKVKIAPGTTVQVLVSAIGPFATEKEKVEEKDKELKDLKEAKADAKK